MPYYQAIGPATTMTDVAKAWEVLSARKKPKVVRGYDRVEMGIEVENNLLLR